MLRWNPEIYVNEASTRNISKINMTCCQYPLAQTDRGMNHVDSIWQISEET